METIAAKVDGMSKIIMASSADAWLVNLPGMSRRHEVLTQEQYKNDTSTARDNDSPGGSEEQGCAH